MLMDDGSEFRQQEESSSDSEFDMAEDLGDDEDSEFDMAEDLGDDEDDDMVDLIQTKVLEITCQAI